MNPPSSGAPRHRFRRLTILVGLAGLAVTQPLLETFGRSPETFVVLGVGRLTALIWVTVVLLGPALALWILEASARSLSVRFGKLAEVATVAILISLLASRLFNRYPLAVVGVCGLVLGAGLGLAIRRVPFLATWASWLSVASGYFAISFLFLSPVSALLFPGTDNGPVAERASSAPVVIIVLDELPTASLLDGSGRIDQAVFPGFDRLAERSTWYRNATTVAPQTLDALPALATGRFPQADGRAAVSSEYPDSLFSLLRSSHDVTAHEQITRLCASTLCDATDQQGILDSLVELVDLSRQTYWRTVQGGDDATTFIDAPFDTAAPERFDRFVDSLDASPDTLTFFHTLFPHGPHRYDGDGNFYRAPNFSRALFDQRWLGDTAATLARQRHLEQVRLADAKIERLIDHLTERGEWDDAMVVVTADHGIAYIGNQPDRGLSESNGAQVAWVPMFVKYPRQVEGVIDDRPASIIDVVPTVLDQLGVLADLQNDIDLDGVSMLDKPSDRAEVRISDWDRSPLKPLPGEATVRLPWAEGFQEMLATPPISTDLEGPNGAFAPGPYGPPLMGQTVQALEIGQRRPEQAFLEARYEDLTWGGSGEAPFYVSGHIDRAPSDRPLAIAVNGEIAAVVPTSIFDGRRATSWWSLLPARFFQVGDNDLALYAVTGSPDAPVLEPYDLAID